MNVLGFTKNRYKLGFRNDLEQRKKRTITKEKRDVIGDVSEGDTNKGDKVRVKNPSLYSA